MTPIAANAAHPQPLKIMFYTHGLVDGGAERLWTCLATAMKARGHDVLFVQDFEADDNRCNLDPSIPLLTLGSNHVSAVNRLRAIIKSERPDVALSAIGVSNFKLLLAKSLTRAPTKTIISYHGLLEWQTGWLSWLAYAGLPLMSRRADATIAVSEGLKDYLVKTWRAPSERIITIENPVFFPEDTIVPSPDELAARDPIVLSIGRLVAEKDFITLIRAFAQLEQRDARLVILGKGPEDRALADEVQKLGLADRIELAGYSRQPWQHYASARCYVLPSYSEAFGNVVIEALAHGLPVVSTDCDGPLHILDNGRHGRIIPKRDVAAMAEAIAAALDNPGDPASRRARADVFSFTARVPAYQALVENLSRKGRYGLAEAINVAIATNLPISTLPL